MNPTSRMLLPLRRILQNQFRRKLTSKTAAEPNLNDEPTEVVKNIVVKQTGPITLFGINRPEKKNSLDTAAANELSQALDTFEENEECKIGIIHGIGGSFCAGFDLDEIAKNEVDIDNLPHFGLLSTRNVLSKKPLIASINGYAVGVGFELALMCDLRIVEEHARMGFLNRRLGIPIMCGGTVRLPAMVGHSRAMDMILTGREINAEEAFKWGIANRLVACGAEIERCL
ncbi:hypothetical protein PV326_009290 [Microctonus aethiopoides]|nr:hypothetical protein PV326_009290 [Microctonus aethiopoides]